MTLKSPPFRTAMKAAALSDGPVRVGAVLIKNRKIIAWSCNYMTKTHPRMARLGAPAWPMIHAELAVMLGTHKHDLRGSEIVLYRERADGSIGMSKPCSLCQKLLAETGVSRVFYTDPQAETCIGVWRP